MQPTPGAPFDDRYVDFVYQPTRNAQGEIDGIFVAGVDVTGREFAALRNKALAELADCIRDIEDADELAYAAAGVLGRALHVSRAGYGTIDPIAETIHITRDWNMPGVQSLAGVLHFRDYGSYIENLKRGETVVVADAYKDPRTADGADALKAISAQGFVNMPVTEQGGMVALLYLNHADARHWSAEDLSFIRDVAERIRTAVERRRAEAELRERERRYRALFDAIDEGFCIIEFIDGPHGPLSDYIHLEANPATSINAGTPDVVGKTARELLGDEADELVNLYAGVLQTGEPIRIERELETTGRWLELAAFRIEPVNRAQVAVLFRDLTARRLAESALRESEERFRTLARAMPNQAWTANPNGLLDWFNDGVYDLSGAAPGSLDGVEWAAIVHPEDIPNAQARWLGALQSGEAYETQFRLRRGDGAYRWHLARAAPIRDERGAVIKWIGTNTDIHDQKEASAILEQAVEERTRELLHAQEALRQSQKMEAVGQLTGGLAHDFNNLLAGISGSLELLAKRLAEGRTTGLERYLSGAQESARRAASLTQRLLAFSRRQTLDPRPIDVNKLVVGLEDLIRRSVGPDVAVEVAQAGGLWATRIDAPQLENALLNLCINARDAMAPKGGRLTIETANKWLDERAARDRELPPGQYVALCVTDTGTGMSPDVISRAFDPFFTTKPLGQGTGLGLSMVYGFVRQSGGQIRIYSELGAGTTVCLYLPRHFGEAEDAATRNDANIIEQGHGEVVLVVDDEVVLRMLMLDVLQEGGYRAIEAADGPSALKILQSDTRVDLLITDVGLPNGLNGRQVADAARKTRPNLKVLFITGYAENAVVGNGHLDPGMQVMTKPFEIAAFSQKVRDMIDAK
jgi:PAS domain S-box-containing protein